jgi:hypothetical protein
MMDFSTRRFAFSFALSFALNRTAWPNLAALPEPVASQFF